MVGMMNQNLIEKLKKLLNMAKGGTGNEADIALQKAQQIAAENDVDLAVVAISEEKEAPVEMVEDEVQHGKRLPIFSRYAHWILNKHFNVKILLSGSRWSGRSVLILGNKPDVEFAKFVKSFIEEDMQRRWDYYRKTNNVELRLKHTWANGCFRGLDTKLTTAKETAKNEKISSMPEPIRATVENKYALVVKTRQNQIEDFMKRRYPRTSNRSCANHTDWRRGDVHSDGFSTGLSMNISRPIEGQRCLS
jgi:hypothetical protein